jgi:hypothetical protein
MEIQIATRKRAQVLREIGIFLIYMILGFSLLAVVGLVGYEGLEVFKPKKEQGRKEAFEFTEKMAPELHSKMVSITSQIGNAESRIEKLRELERKFPGQRHLTVKAKEKWEVLRATLVSTLTRIENKTQEAYVLYKVDELQGRQSFERIKDKLIESANHALSAAHELTSVMKEVTIK